MPEEEEHVRLLVCLTCKSVDEVADFLGRPGEDLTLEKATQKHNFGNGDLHEIDHVYRVPVKHWNREDIQRDLLKRIWARNGHTGMEPWVYENVNTFKSDAYKCWNGKQRPKRCGDFHSDKMQLTPPTKEERRDADLGKYKASAGQRRYLCDYCVCRMQVEKEIGEKNNV